MLFRTFAVDITLGFSLMDTAPMNTIRRILSRIEHEPLPEEVAQFSSLGPHEFDTARAKHLQRRVWPQESTGVGILFLLAAVGFPICLLNGLFNSELAYLVAAAFWLVVAFATYAYLAVAAGYWREHRAIIEEEQRRYGKSSFS